MPRINLLIFLLLFSFYLKAQSNLDSLYSIWEDNSQTDSVRTNAFKVYIGKGFLFSNPDSAYMLAKNLLTFAQEQKYSSAKAVALHIQATSLFFQGNYTDALDYYQRSLIIREEIGDTQGIANSLNNIGNIYYQQSNFPQALDYYQRSLKNYELLIDKNGIARSLGNIGLIHSDLGNLSEALDYSQRSLKIREEIGDQYGIAVALPNIGNIYYAQGKFSQALDYYKRGLKIYEAIQNKAGIASSLRFIGGIYELQEKYPEAHETYLSSLKIREEMGDKNGIAVSQYSIGRLYLAQGKYYEAISLCDKSLNLSKENQAIDREKQACSCLYSAYKSLGNSNKALDYYEQFTQLKDSIYNTQNTKKLTQLEMQYDFDKQEAATQMEQEKKDAVAAQELERNKLERNGFMAGFAIVFLFAGVFFRQRNRIGKEKERSDDLLMNILPKEVAEELKDKGHSDAQFINNVSVLFTDFKGFTALSEQLTPNELVADLHFCFSEFDHICEKYGIEKIKTIGDAYMAAGGLPSPNTTHAQDVVKAAMEMIEVVKKNKEKKIAADQPFFEVRIGIHTGPVVAGIVGIKKFQYDIWGDTVNIASRMESSGEVGKVNISAATYNLLKEDSNYTFQSRGKIQAKGKGEMEMFFVQ